MDKKLTRKQVLEIGCGIIIFASGFYFGTYYKRPIVKVYTF